MKLKNKQALVTGGSDGLGLAITRKLLEKGAKVAICGLGQENLDKAKRSLDNKKLSIYQGDVADYQQVERMVKAVGKIDLVVNNAGIWICGGLEKNKYEEIDRAIDVNTKGVIYVTRAVLPQMKKSNEGYIFNVISSSGIKPKENQSVYVASKYGVTGFTKSLQKDLYGSGIKAVGFYPGGMKTNLVKKAKHDLDVSKWMEVDKVAEIVVFMIERDETMIMDHVELNKRIV